MCYVRFFIVTAVGLLLDISLAWLLVRYVGLPLTLAAACGFMTAVAFNYLLHEIWTFARAGKGISLNRARQFLAVQGLALMIRLSFISLLEHASTVGSNELIVLGLSSILTFGITLLTSTRSIFRS